jgi:hypothetical protein
VGRPRAAFRATTELHRDDFSMNHNQVVQAGIAAIGATLKVELDIQAVQGEALPQGQGQGQGQGQLQGQLQGKGEGEPDRGTLSGPTCA